MVLKLFTFCNQNSREKIMIKINILRIVEGRVGLKWPHGAHPSFYKPSTNTSHRGLYPPLLP
jgi:hypothetical protein